MSFRCRAERLGNAGYAGIDRGYRECSPTNYFEEYLKCGNDNTCQGEVRLAFRGFERGRYNKGISELHNFAARLDLDEQRAFKKEFPDMVKAINQYAKTEDLIQL